MIVSIIVTLFNGRKYLIEQLDSIRNQSYPVDEVLLIDDCSTDDTCSVVQGYINEYKLSNWKLIINEKNMGWKRNFWNGFKIARGDLIFPCDQDDIWFEDKISNMVKLMEQNNHIMLLTSDYSAFNDNIQNTYGPTSIQNITRISDELSKVNFDYNFLLTLRPGCTFCFRKELMEKADKFWTPDEPHDSTLWMTAILNDGLFNFDKSTMYYRRHVESATNLNENKKIPNADKYLESRLNKTIYGSIAVLKKLFAHNSIPDKYKDMAKKTLAFYENRAKYLTEKNIILYIKTIFKYKPLYYTKKAMIGDLYMLCFSKRRK